MAVGCSHGHWADPTALDAVLKFGESWHPHTRVHLGDYLDTTAFRSGADAKDRQSPIHPDVEKGIEFLQAYRPDILFNGNHDIRLWNAAEHPDAILAGAAQGLIKQIYTSLPAKCQFIDTYDIKKSVLRIADTSLLHGFMYNENAIRDHAEHFGKCMIAHLHTVGQAAGRRDSGGSCYCVGYLGDAEKFKYAKQRRSMAKWSQGFAWGEYSDKEMVIWLNERTKEGTWRMPL